MKNVGFAAVQRDPGPPKLVSVDADRIVLATLAKNVTYHCDHPPITSSMARGRRKRSHDNHQIRQRWAQNR
jgi:hypothetical protein